MSCNVIAKNINARNRYILLSIDIIPRVRLWRVQDPTRIESDTVFENPAKVRFLLSGSFMIVCYKSTNAGRSLHYSQWKLISGIILFGKHPQYELFHFKSKSFYSLFVVYASQ